MSNALPDPLPRELPAEWFSVTDPTVEPDNAIGENSALLCWTWDRLTGSTRSEVLPGTVMFALSGPFDGLVNVGWHKTFYTSPPMDRGAVFTSRMIALHPCAFGDIEPGDLLVRRRIDRDQGTDEVQVAIVTRLHGTSSGMYFVQRYVPKGEGVATELVSATSAIWSLNDTERLSYSPVMRARMKTRNHPLNPAHHTIEREDTTVSTDTTTPEAPATLCQDPAHEGIVVQMQEKDAKIVALRTELNEARRLHRQDIDRIADGFWQEASDRDWCDDAIEAIEKINEGLEVELTIPMKTYEVAITTTGTTNISMDDAGLSLEVTVYWQAQGKVTVEAKTAEAAEEMVGDDTSFYLGDWDDVCSAGFDVSEVEPNEVSVDDEEKIRDIVSGAYSMWDITDASVGDAEEV